MNITSPTAGVVVYSYKDRGGSKADVFNQSVETIYITKSIISITTTKYKSRPSGNFEIILAPTKNWIAAISPGSWLEIHMSPSKMTTSDLERSSQETLKMIGCVDSVRMSVGVDQASGARVTTYSVVGRDWGCVFESHLYVDSTAQTASDSALQQALKPLFGNIITGQGTAISGIYSSTKLIKELLSAWGTTMALLPTNTQYSLDKLNPFASYAIPDKLVSKLDAPTGSGRNLAKTMQVKSGYLSGYDKYSDYEDSFGILNTQGLIGINMVWQLLSSHCNNILNELVADLRWESDKPSITLYKRIKPFALSSNFKNTWSRFFNLKRHDLKTLDIISLNVGDNTEDVVNYIEVLPDLSIYSLSSTEKLGVLSDAKARNHKIRLGLVSRHGIKPLLYSTSFTPSVGTASWQELANWLPILEHWYFDCHKMLNGVVTLLGQQEYIGVGNNISIDAKVLGKTSYVVGKPAKLLAHVESVQHRFSIHENESRSFITSISFVRGVMVDDGCKNLVGIDPYGIETMQDLVPSENQKIQNVYTE